MSFASYDDNDIADDIQMTTFEDLRDSLRYMPPGHLTDKMKTYADSLDGGHMLLAVWNEFTNKISSDLPVYIFFHLLKSLELVPKKCRNDIVKDLLMVVKYKIQYSYDLATKTRVYSLTSMNLFHPMYLGISLKVLTDYLTVNRQLSSLNDIPRSILYFKLIDELSQQSCSIFIPMYVYTNAYKTYMDATNFDVRFEPNLSFEELKRHLIRHSTQDLYASKYNRNVEHNIGVSVRCKRPPLIPFQEHDLLETYQTKMDIQFNPQQIEAIMSTISSPITLLQGSAGTGKSTIVTAITDTLLSRHESILFLTISTKARDVLRGKLEDYRIVYNIDLSIQAHTIAHFLCTPAKRWDNILVDEASMIGNSQCTRFLASFEKRLILIGDGKQVLPVHQIGTPFLCLQTSAASYINICVLTLIQRQTQDNPILQLVQTTIDKNPIVLPEYGGQEMGVFYKTIQNEQEHAKFYISFYGQNMCCIKPAYYMATSKIIHAELSKDKIPLVDKPEKRYMGDFLMRTKNETFTVKRGETKISFDVPNGSYCTIVRIKKPFIEVEYSDIYIDKERFHEWVLPRDLCMDFQLAYCQSTHKFQGSEYNIVLFNLNNNPYLLKEGGKNIFYTSITRAKKLLIICGTTQDKTLLSRISANSFACPTHDIFTPVQFTVPLGRYKKPPSYNFVPLYTE